ncbi:hypothetical protein Ocin01_01769 [Orchesella cincta]|uniref:Uncharacterized protein n=1 Tax=Orchesella cincta TaxID=48709 RepID=A0A1D2NI59_ORCCI|nr:hypothetical protein Ocin01_01769 [Orchesella cincta]
MKFLSFLICTIVFLVAFHETKAVDMAVDKQETLAGTQTPAAAPALDSLNVAEVSPTGTIDEFGSAPRNEHEREIDFEQIIFHGKRRSQAG